MQIDNSVDVIVGVAAAGIPWTSFISDRLKKPLAYVRNKPKEHGRGNQIEGAIVKGKKIIIEDLITTRKSSLVAVQALKEQGVKSLEVKTIFSYGFKEAKENYEQHQCDFSSLSNFDTLINLLVMNNLLPQEKADIALQWNKNPQKWNQ